MYTYFEYIIPKLIARYNQNELANLVGLSKSYINDLKAGTQTHLTKVNLLKLHKYLDKNLVMNDYFSFVLNQKLILKEILNKYSIKELSKILKVH